MASSLAAPATSLIGRQLWPQIRSLELRAESRDVEVLKIVDGAESDHSQMLQWESLELRNQARILKARIDRIKADKLDGEDCAALPSATGRPGPRSGRRRWNGDLHEVFDTGLKKIRHEIKNRLAPQGLFGTITSDNDPHDISAGARVEIHAKGKAVGMSFDRKQIEGCCLRVAGTVLSGVIAMVEELSAATRSDAQDLRS